MLQRVLIFTDDPDMGGVAQYNHSLLCALKDAGWIVTCAQSWADNPLVRLQAQHGIQHHWLPYDSRHDFPSTLNNIPDAKKVLSASAPDLVIFSNGCPLSNFAARRAAVDLAIPFAIVEHFVAPYLAERFASLLEEQNDHYKKAAEVIAVSRNNLDLLHERFRLPWYRGKVIHYGRPDHYFEAPNPQTRGRQAISHRKQYYASQQLASTLLKGIMFN